MQIMTCLTAIMEVLLHTVGQYLFWSLSDNESRILRARVRKND